MATNIQYPAGLTIVAERTGPRVRREDGTYTSVVAGGPVYGGVRTISEEYDRTRRTLRVWITAAEAAKLSVGESLRVDRYHGVIHHVGTPRTKLTQTLVGAHRWEEVVCCPVYLRNVEWI